MDRKALLILGMHRAGTSALARVCSLRGADLPQHVLPANAGNETGYWESRGVVELNDRILDYFDLAWDDPFAFDRLPAPEDFPPGFRNEATGVIQREYGDSPLFVLKDPRCTLLHRFWIDALRSIGIEPHAIVMMRPHGEVVESLVRRDHTSATSAGLLYVAYGFAAAQTADLGASFMTYGQLVTDWRGSTDRIAAEQRFAWPHEAQDAAARIQAYLQPPKRKMEPVELPRRLAAWAETTWGWCRDAASGHVAPRSQLHELRDAFIEAGELFASSLRDRGRRLRETDALHEAATRERDAALTVYHDTDALLIAARSEYELQLANSEAELERTRSEYELQLANSEAELERTRSEYEIQLERVGAELRQAQSDYWQRDQECTAAKTALAATHAALGAAYRESDALRQELAAMLDSRSWKLTAPLRAAMRRIRHEAPADLQRLQQLLDGDARGAIPAIEAVDATPVAGGIPDTPVSSVPAPRSHRALRGFLVAEFGEQVATDVVLRIDRYRLPIPGQQARNAAEVACSPEAAAAWVRDIARRADRKDDPGPVPDVSIVIPVYNQLPFTLACIDALLGHQTRYSFEILVGDDASTDATAQALATPIRGVRHVRHPQNLGFVRNCNETARQARGRYVLFLNNDTLVLPRWLDELVATLEADAGIGLAGSKLVYPDGRLQECGAIVWRDGSAWNFGRLDDPCRPEYGYLRDVDYVSGASIILRRETWCEHGGFDELFVPAYAEDADLAFRVRAAGLRTVVQPLSQLLHFEGISSGTDLGSGAKAYQVDNLRKLRDRWQDVLAGHRPNAEHPELEKERAVARRVLFVDHCTPTPAEDAGSVVAFEVMKAFIDQGYKVTFIPEDNFADVGAATRDLQRIGIEPIYHPAYSTMNAFLSRRDDPFDVVFLHRFGVGDKHLDVLRRKYPAARIIFLNADLHYVREMRQAELDGDAAALARSRKTRDRELRVIARADVALVHSDYERTLLATELPDARVVLFPLIHDPVEEVLPLDGREGVCFVGGFRHPPNVDGVCWLVDIVWPLVLDAVPGARLYIVGSHMPLEVSVLGERPGVIAMGFVDDLDGFLRQRRVSVAPLRYGAGAKGKVAGSLAQGVPVVCTPIAAEGMQLEPGRDILVGESPEELARHLVALLLDDDEWRRLSAAGLAYAHAVTSRARAAQRIRGLLQPGAC